MHTFEFFAPRPGTKDALAAFQAVADGSGPPLLLCGGITGNGKTYLMEALTIEIYKRGAFVRLLTAFDYLAVLKGCMEPGHIPPYEEQLRRYMEEPRLLIDDLGSGTKGSDWEWGVWEAIINYRYQHRLLTVITTNLDLAQLPARIQSRFSDPAVGRVVLNNATDYRRERRK